MTPTEAFLLAIDDPAVAGLDAEQRIAIMYSDDTGRWRQLSTQHHYVIGVADSVNDVVAAVPYLDDLWRDRVAALLRVTAARIELRGGR